MTEYIPLTSARAFEYLKETKQAKPTLTQAIGFGGVALAAWTMGMAAGDVVALLADPAIQGQYHLSAAEQDAFLGGTAAVGAVGVALSLFCGAKSLDSLLSHAPGWKDKHLPTYTFSGKYTDEPTPLQRNLGVRLYFTDTLEEACKKHTPRGTAQLVNGIGITKLEPVKEPPTGTLISKQYTVGPFLVIREYGTTFRVVLEDGTEQRTAITYRTESAIREKKKAYAVLKQTRNGLRLLDIGPAVTNEDYTGKGRKKKENLPEPVLTPASIRI